MSLMTSTSDRLRSATQLWHTYLSTTGQRFDLAQFLKDPAMEKQTIDAILATGDPKLVGLAQEWLLGTGQPVPRVIASRVVPPAAPAANPSPDTPKPPARYLRGVR